VGNLYLVATPIGNLEDITLRAIRVLKEVDLIAAEDTRHSRQLLNHYAIHTPLTSYHEHSQASKRSRILEALDHGDVALISDAGAPGLNDPGFALIQEAIAAGHQITPIPGPSAPIAALTASGLPTDTFLFLGYIPRKQGDRKALLEAISKVPHTVISFEVPNRLERTLEAMAEILGEDRQLVLCRELTKRYEDFKRGTIGELVQALRSEKPRGEYTLILGGAAHIERWSEAQVRAAFEQEMKDGSSRGEAARSVAKLSGWSRREIYKLGLEE
jgi:16S rRNA (cytidine1402-2'-O)-methyltransferase